MSVGELLMPAEQAMNTRNADVVQRLNPAAHDFRRDTGLLGDGNIGCSSRNDEDTAMKPSLRIAHGDDPGGFVVDRPPIDPFNDGRDVASGPGGEKRSMVFQQRSRNAADLRWRLAFT